MNVHRDSALTEVTEHITQLEAELGMLREAAKALKGAGVRQATVSGGGRPMRARRSTASRPRPTTGQRATTGRRPTGNGRVSDEKILETLGQMNGSSSIKLAERCGISQETALRRLHALQQAGSVTREGERQKTRWFAQTPVAA